MLILDEANCGLAGGAPGKCTYIKPEPGIPDIPAKSSELGKIYFDISYVK